jgi:predicted transcriptional regulator of viral defense system
MKVWPVHYYLATLSYMSRTSPLTKLDKLPGVFTHGEAMTAGLSDRDLYAMRDSGEIDRVARGIYAHLGVMADFDLVEIAVRASDATLCLTSALAHHDLIDDIPAVVQVALPRSHRPPRTQAPTQWSRFDPETFDVGRTTLSITEELTIGLYSPTRSIVDAYRLRHIHGVDQAHEALKRWLRLPGNQPIDLLKVAESFPTAVPIIRTTLQTLL